MSIAALGGAPNPTLGESFPVICEDCLGPNPYTRMIRTEMGKECRISGAPFAAFRWQGALKRWKETIICAAVAQEKNCCQSCLNDLEYGVPFHVRDQVMEALGEDDAPTSEVNKEYWWATKRQKLLDQETGQGGFDTYERLHKHADKLKEIAAMKHQPVTWDAHRGPLTPEEQERLRQRRLGETRAPADTSVTSLYVGGVPAHASRKDLMPYFMAYGEVRELTLDTQRLAAVVTYKKRGDAEVACKALHGNFTFKGSRLRVQWAKRKNRAGDASSSKGTGHTFYGEGAADPIPAPPPRAAAGSSAAAAVGSKRRAPPGVRLPPGVAPPAPIGAPVAYPSQNPEARGALPERAL